MYVSLVCDLTFTWFIWNFYLYWKYLIKTGFYYLAQQVL